MIRTLQERGTEPARHQLVANLTALLAVGLPATIGLAVLAKPVAKVLLGPEFRDDAATLIPVIAAAALLRDLKAYYLDQAFQLGRSTAGRGGSPASPWLTDLMLVIWWAYASIVAYALGWR